MLSLGGKRSLPRVSIFVSTLVVLACLALTLSQSRSGANTAQPLKVRLDNRGPCVILATASAAKKYQTAIAAAKLLHPEASFAVFDHTKLETARQHLKRSLPRFVVVLIDPSELDANFAWAWLNMTSSLDDDPFVDTRTGFITGRTPDDAAAFVNRISAAVRGHAVVPAQMIDNLGPNEQAPADAFFKSPGAFMLAALGRHWTSLSISHGKAGFTDRQLNSLDGCGIVHIGGHGYPDRIVDGMNARQVKHLTLSPCIVFNGACYTGVTGRWFEPWTQKGTIAEHAVLPDNSFSLAMLSNNALAYFAAVHPDHGVPVYQEMEHLACSGCTLGDVIKHTYDSVVIGRGGKRCQFASLTAGARSPVLSPAEAMLGGTATRVLFGDPSMSVTNAILSPPLDVKTEQRADGLRIVATVSDPEIKCSLADTFYSDLSRTPNMYNDRALLVVPLPATWRGGCAVEVVGVAAGTKPLKNRLVGYAIETDGKEKQLHVQVDIESDSFMKSPFRVPGAKVELKVRQINKTAALKV